MFPIFWLKPFVAFSTFRFPFFRKINGKLFHRLSAVLYRKRTRGKEARLTHQSVRNIIFPNRPGVLVSVWHSKNCTASERSVPQLVLHKIPLQTRWHPAEPTVVTRKPRTLFPYWTRPEARSIIVPDFPTLPMGWR